MRVSDGDGCPPCHVYLIASGKSGIRHLLPEIFLGATVKDWQPLKKALTRKQAEALAVIDAWLKTAPVGEKLTFTTVQKALKMDKSNFKSRIRRAPEFLEALSARGLVEVGTPWPRSWMRRRDAGPLGPGRGRGSGVTERWRSLSTGSGPAEGGEARARSDMERPVKRLVVIVSVFRCAGADRATVEVASTTVDQSDSRGSRPGGTPACPDPSGAASHEHRESGRWPVA